MSRRHVGVALVLSTLTLLFAARVAGQALVAFLGVPWLPPMQRWYSGLLPYPILLPLQLAILAGQATLDGAVWAGRASFARPRPRTARALRWLSYAYAASMITRYALMPSHLVPVAFHLVLAAYLFTLARLWAPPGRATGG